jgi:hypothetical protein
LPTGTVLEQSSVNGEWTYSYAGSTFTHNTHYKVKEMFKTTQVRMVSPAEHTMDSEENAGLEIQFYADNTKAADKDEEVTRHEHFIFSAIFYSDENAPTTLDAANAADDTNKWGYLLFG